MARSCGSTCTHDMVDVQLCLSLTVPRQICVT